MQIIKKQPDAVILLDGYQYFQNHLSTLAKTVFCFPWVLYYSRKFQKQYLQFCFEYRRVGSFKNYKQQIIDFNSFEHYYDDLNQKNLSQYDYFHCFSTKNTEVITIKNQQNQTISALIANKKSQTKWLIALHGWTENKYLALRQAAWFYENGYNILTFDSMAHGLSYGKYTDIGLTAATDLSDIIQFLQSTYQVTEIGLIGNSMGASCALYYSQITKQTCVNWIVADCGFANLETQLRYIMFYRFLKPWWLTCYRLASNVKKFTKTDIKQMHLITPPTNQQIPILYIHGYEDNFVPFFMSKAMAAAKIDDLKVEHLWLEKVNHVEAISKGHEQYVNKIANFVAKNQVKIKYKS